MGRKIPGKKHKGVKDPEKQRMVQQEKLKLLINRPPSNPDVQEIPKSVLELNRLRDLVKTGKFKKKRRRKINMTNGSLKLKESDRNEKPWPSLKQKPGESDEAYFWRINRATDEIINEAQIEAKHDISVKRDKTGKIDNVQPYKIINTSLGNSDTKKKKKCVTNYLLDKKERMKLRRKLKLETKKLSKIKIKEDAIEKKKDFVQFGEVAHHPPQLRRRPKGCSIEKPGCKDLLLKSMFSNKDKSMSEIKQLTEEREKVMKAYQAMKLKNRSVSNQS